MAFLLDTGIILRLADKSDLLRKRVEAATDILIDRREVLLIATQNVAEFWNVATRPIENNGKALPTQITAQLFDATITPICSILPERNHTPAIFQRLLERYDVVGKQVHDAHLVAVMLSWHVESILTLNPRNFRRFEPEGIAVIEPAAIVE